MIRAGGRKLEKCNKPILFIHGTVDTIIPQEASERLHK